MWMQTKQQTEWVRNITNFESYAFTRLLIKFIWYNTNYIFITVYNDNLNSTNFIVVKNTTKMFQYGVHFINYNMNMLGNSPLNIFCTDPIFSNPFTIHIIFCLLRFSPRPFYFIFFLTISGVCVCKYSFKTENTALDFLSDSFSMKFNSTKGMCWKFVVSLFNRKACFSSFFCGKLIFLKFLFESQFTSFGQTYIIYRNFKRYQIFWHPILLYPLIHSVFCIVPI